MKPFVSIALATYNGEKYLPAQLDSIARQTVCPDHLVVGDDASNDRTERLVREFAVATGIPLSFERNDERLGSTRNFARILSRAPGEIIFLCDQDDVWVPTKLARALAEFERRPTIG